MEKYIDDADSGERPRFDVFDAASEGQESLQAVGDAVFDLLWRHSRIERRDHYHRYVDRREHIDRHPRNADSAQDRHDKAGDHDEVRCPDGEFRHGLRAYRSESNSFGLTLSPALSPARRPVMIRSDSRSPETISARWASSTGTIRMIPASSTA